MISSTLFFITAFASIAQIPTVTAGPACVQRHKNQADCIAECAARWGWPGAVMGTDPWGNVISPSDAQSMSDVIASACGAVESFVNSFYLTELRYSLIVRQSPDGALSGQSSSVVASFSNLAAALPSSATTLIVSSSVTTSTLTSLSATTPSSSSSKLSSTRSISSSLSSSSTSLSTRPTVSSSSSASSTRTSSSSLTTVRTTTPQTTAKTTSSSSNGSSSSTGGSSGSSSGSTPGSSSGSTGGTSNSDIQAYLSAHNTVRAQHGASPLTWNNTLANAAQKWANGCVFQHSGGSLGPFGGTFIAHSPWYLLSTMRREPCCWNWKLLWNCPSSRLLDK